MKLAKMSDELEALLKRSKEYMDAMTPEAREAMFRKQAEGWAKSEASWPKPKFKMINGVKVYDSYEDYCND